MTVESSKEPEVQAPRPQIPRLGAAASGLVALLLVGALFLIPFLGLLIAPLGSLPVLHYQAGGAPGYRAWGPVAALLVVASLGGFAGFALPLLAAYALLVILPSATVDIWLRWRLSEGQWIAAATLAGLLATLIAVIAVASPQTPMEAVAGWMRAASEDAAELYAAWGLAEGSVELALDAAERAAAWVLPSVPVAYLVVVLFWMRPRLPLLGLPVPVATFEEYRNDEWLAALFVVAGGGTLLLGGTLRWVVFCTGFSYDSGPPRALVRARLARALGCCPAVPARTDAAAGCGARCRGQLPSAPAPA
jgi:hypothetical protein